MNIIGTTPNSRCTLGKILYGHHCPRSVNWLSRNRFLENCLQFMYLFNRIFFYSKSEFCVTGLRWCFSLDANTMDFVYWRWITMRLWSHHFDTSSKLSWRKLWNDLIYFRRNERNLIYHLQKGRGESSLKMQNRSGPRTEPWGTTHLTMPQENILWSVLEIT